MRCTSMSKHFFIQIQFVIILMFFSSISTYVLADEIILENNSGVKIIASKTVDGYAFGTIYLNDKPIEKSLLNGMLLFKNIKNNKL